MTIEPIENKICIKCKWNNYPYCYGTKMDGEYMRNDSLKAGFTCGQKDLDTITEFWIFAKNPNVKTTTDEINELKDRIIELEAKTADLSEVPIKEVVSK